MDLRQLRYFVTIASSGSLVVASKLLNISQPALSKSMRSLESSLGFRVFLRRPHGVGLTVLGEELLTRAQLILGEVARTKSELDALRSTRGGELHIGTLRAAANTKVPVAAARFCAEYPEIRLKIDVDQNSVLIDQLIRGRYDFVIGAGEGDLQPSKLTYEQLWTDRLVFVSRANHPLQASHGGGPVDPVLLASQLWIMPESGTFRTRLDSYFFSVGVQAPAPAIVCAQLQFVRSMLEQGDYLALLPEDSIKLECRYGELVTYPVTSPFLTRSVGLISRRNQITRRSCNSFLDCLRDLCR